MATAIKDERDYAIRKGKILEKFQQDFYTRHKNSSLFRPVLEMLIRDADPYEIIEKLIEINGEQMEQLIDVMPWVSPIYHLKKSTMTPLPKTSIDKLVFLERRNPVIYEIHCNEINGANNLLLSTTNKLFAEKLVNGYNEERSMKLLEALEKRCALICVDEILILLNQDFGVEVSIKRAYWQEVRSHIQSLTIKQ